VYTRRYLDREELARDVLRIRVFYWRRGYREAQVDTLVQRRGENTVAVTFDVREGPPTLVSDVAVTGADSLLSPRRLRRLLVVEPDEPLSLLAVDSSLLAVRGALFELGYADATVDTTIVVDTAAHRGSVRLEAAPGKLATVGPITITGLDKLSERTLRNSMTLREGQVFRGSELFRSQRNLYESSLFRRATIQAVGEDSVKRIVVDVREADMQRVRASAGFNTVEYVQAEGRYSHYNFFGGARRLTVQATVGNLLASQLEGNFPFTGVSDDAFLGGASPFLRPTWLVSAEVRQPWFKSPDNTIALGVFAHRRSNPRVVVDRGQGATASFTRRVAPRANASATYRFETTKIEAGNVYFCVNFGVCDLTTIRTLGGTQRLSPLALLGDVNRSDDPLGPTRGYVARVELEHASEYTASNYEYNRGLIDVAAYRPTLGGTLAAHVRVGRTWALGGFTAEDGDPLTSGIVIHPRKRFYAGGARSVRGFGEAQLGPRVLTIAPSRLRVRSVVDGDTTYRTGCGPTVPITACSLADSTLRARDFTPRPLGSPAVAEVSVEYRRPVWGPLSVAVFLDGAILPAGDDAFFTLDDNFMALTPGFGVRYQSPVGPIRVDVGIDPNVFKPADSRGEVLPVFTQQEVDGVLRIVQVGAGLPPEERPLFRYDPIGDASGFRKVLNALVLHLSIGEAF
jgi:outer membrane protein insertion porin family